MKLNDYKQFQICAILQRHPFEVNHTFNNEVYGKKQAESFNNIFSINFTKILIYVSYPFRTWVIIAAYNFLSFK